MLNTLAKFFFGITIISLIVCVVMVVVLVHLLLFGVIEGDTIMPLWTGFPILSLLWSIMLAGLCKAIEFAIDWFRD